MRNQKSDTRWQKSEVRLAVAIALLLAWAATAQAVQVWLPDSMPVATAGDTVWARILVQGHAGQEVIAADIALAYQPEDFVGTTSFLRGNATPAGWSVLTNPFGRELLIAMAGVDTLNATGGVDTLLKVAVVAVQSGTLRLDFSRFDLNEGQVACTTHPSLVIVGQAEEGKQPVLSGFRSFPNPAYGRVFLQCPSDLAPNARVEICDVGGRLVRTLPVRDGVSWDCRDERGFKVPPGVYVCRLKSWGQSPDFTALKLLLVD